MNLTSILNRVVNAETTSPRTHLYCECRRCGTTVSPETVECPQCETQEIARLELG